MEIPDTVEELQTRTAEKIESSQISCPQGNLKGIPMGLAFENYDEFTDKLSGSRSLHHNMGILNQNEVESDVDLVHITESGADQRPSEHLPRRG